MRHADKCITFLPDANSITVDTSRTYNCPLDSKTGNHITGLHPPRTTTELPWTLDVVGKFNISLYQPERSNSKAFSRAGPATWNALPNHIHTVADPVKFRKLLKSHYSSQATNIC